MLKIINIKFLFFVSGGWLNITMRNSLRLSNSYLYRHPPIKKPHYKK